MAKFKIAVCESVPEMDPGSSEWLELCRVVSQESPHLFLLNELPFGPWIAADKAFDETTWKESCRVHEDGLRRLGEFGATVVAGSRPREEEGKRVNEAFLWTREDGAKGVHTKQYFPDEEGYYETRWFEAGERHFRLGSLGVAQAGFLICTELMFNEQARQYGRRGADVILVPRAVGRASLDRWQVAMRMAAIVSGSYVASSNRSGVDARGQDFGGCGWIVDPTGEVVRQTSAVAPVAFYEIDTAFAAASRREYPCYVKE